MSLAFPRGLAVFYGVFLPIGETVRRWHQLKDVSMWPAWLDDILIGAFLRRVAPWQGQDSGTALAGVGVGLRLRHGLLLIFRAKARLNEADPGPLSTHGMLMLKGVGLLLAIAALIMSLREQPHASTP